MNEPQKPNKSTYPRYSPARASSRVRGNNGLNVFPGGNASLNGQKRPYPRMDIQPPGQIIDPKYSWATTENILSRLKTRNMLEENKDLLSRFIMDARLGKTIKKGAKKRIAALRQAKYVHDLAKLDTYFNKPLDKINQREMERFVLALEDGEITQKNGKPYAKETQVAIKKIIIKFYKWLNNGNIPDLVSWIDTSFKLPDYHALNKTQIDRIISLVTGSTPETTARNKAIIVLLFDSGARADELLNIRIRHLEIREGEYWVRIEHSKTRPRTISLPYCREHLNTWLDIHPTRENPDAQLFPIRHNALGNVVRRAGRIIGEKLTPHGIRHSSATFWASRLTPYQLAYRFGWSMSSKQPSRYIDRAGVDQEKVLQVAQNEITTALKEQNQELHRRLALMEEQFERFLKDDIEEIKNIMRILGNPNKQ